MPEDGSRKAPRILIVDDEASIRRVYSKFLSGKGYEVLGAASLSEARKVVASRRFDAVILDIHLPDGTGIDLVAELRKDYPELAIVLITGEGDIPMAVEAMRLGGDNFLTKPVDLENLNAFLMKSLEVSSLRRRDFSRRRQDKKSEWYFGDSLPMKRALELADMASENEAPILIEGETGTGKGLLGRHIHKNSSRNATEMVEINCSGLRGDLLSSELFGHVKGAFTSAVKERRGLIEAADGGTLFLDEIGDMDMSVQAQFLKVLEEKQYRRLGEVKMRRSDFRLICATNQSLKGKADEGSFRDDLLFRINVFPITLPPLRERPEDLPGLIRSILKNLGAGSVEISPPSRDLLESYHWPGNVRELKNVLERAVLLSRGEALEPKHFPGLETGERKGAFKEGAPKVLDQLQEKYILEVMEKAGGDVAKAAENLNISKATLYRRLQKIRNQTA